METVVTNAWKPCKLELSDYIYYFWRSFMITICKLKFKNK